MGQITIGIKERTEARPEELDSLVRVERIAGIRGEVTDGIQEGMEEGRDTGGKGGRDAGGKGCGGKGMRDGCRVPATEQLLRSWKTRWIGFPSISRNSFKKQVWHVFSMLGRQRVKLNH